jgi:uncharacterized protein (DUF1684 family)
MAHPRLELADWRRRVLAMYARVREAGGDPWAAGEFRAARDELFREHPESPLPPEDRAGFAGIPYFAHRPELRVEAALVPDDSGAELIIPTSTGEPTRFSRIGSVHPSLEGREVSLAVYWLEGYGGGLFLPFRDALAGGATYGGGRYLLDTVKGADLGAGAGGDRLVLDFNYAYNPSCAYDPRWSCPLAPPENRIDVAVEAGERMPGKA